LQHCTPQSTIISICNAISTAAKTSRTTELPPWQNGDRLHPELEQKQTLPIFSIFLTTPADEQVFQ
jgi:hypothetical protein